MDDFDRPLAKRGRKEAAEVAELIVRECYFPARVLCSTALRTRETLAALLPILPEDTEVTLTREIYEATADRLLRTIRQVGDSPSLLLVGHNPGLEDLARMLADDGSSDALVRLRAKFPPAGLAVIRFAADSWSKIVAGEGRLAAFHTPQV
jgi:phosphohistidine phosphatase